MDDKRDTMLTYAGGLTMVLGIWLAVSSLLFGLSPAAFTSQIIVAMILILAGAAEMYSRSTWISWLSAVAGLWLVVSPIFITVSDAGFWNQMVVGLIAIGFGVWDRNVITSGLRPHAHQ
jgi:hypothetical protein